MATPLDRQQAILPMLDAPRINWGGLIESAGIDEMEATRDALTLLTLLSFPME